MRSSIRSRIAGPDRVRDQMVAERIAADERAEGREMSGDWPAWVNGSLLWDVVIRNGFDGQVVIAVTQCSTGNLAQRVRPAKGALREARKLAQNARMGLVDMRRRAVRP
jgi:hypothetical protein